MTGYLESSYFNLSSSPQHARKEKVVGGVLERKCMKLTSRECRVISCSGRWLPSPLRRLQPSEIIFSCECEGVCLPPFHIKCCAGEQSSMWSEPRIVSAVFLSKTRDKNAASSEACS